MSRFLRAAAIAACLTPCVALADDGATTRGMEQGPTFFVGISRASVDENFEGVNFDSSSTGWSAGAGWRFFPWLATEVGYTRISSMSEEIAGVDVRLKGDAITASVLPTLPLSERFSLFARLGVAKWSATTRASLGTASASADDDGTDVIYGAGVQVYAEKGASVRFEYLRTKLDDVDLDQLAASVVFTF